MANSLLVLDFDLTLVTPHTFRELQGIFGVNPDQGAVKDYVTKKLQSNEYQLINSEKMLALIRAVLYTDNYVAITSFTHYSGAIDAVLNHLGLSKDEIERIKIVAFLPKPDEQKKFGKNNHIRKLIDDFDASDVDIEKIMLVDDDQNNIEKIKRDLRGVVPGITPDGVSGVLVPGQDNIVLRDRGDYILEAVTTFAANFKTEELYSFYKLQLARNKLQVLSNLDWAVNISNLNLSLAKPQPSEQSARLVLNEILQKMPELDQYLTIAQSSRGGYTVRVSLQGAEALLDDGTPAKAKRFGRQGQQVVQFTPPRPSSASVSRHNRPSTAAVLSNSVNPTPPRPSSASVSRHNRPSTAAIPETSSQNGSITFRHNADGSGIVAISAKDTSILKALPTVNGKINKVDSGFEISFSKGALNPEIIAELINAANNVGLSIRNNGDKAMFSAGVMAAKADKGTNHKI